MKNNIDYYQHFANSHLHPKFKMLRIKYGWEGEGKFWALNNMIAQAKGCKLDLSRKFIVADVLDLFQMSYEEFYEFIDYLADVCELIIKENDIITTKIVLENFNNLMTIRKRNKENYERRKGEKNSSDENVHGTLRGNSTVEKCDSTVENGNSSDEFIQRKGKKRERKLEEIKKEERKEEKINSSFSKINSSFSLAESPPGSVNGGQNVPGTLSTGHRERAAAKRLRSPPSSFQSAAPSLPVGRADQFSSEIEREDNAKFVKSLFIKRTKIKDPHEESQIKPVVRFLEQIPEAMNVYEVRNCIAEAFEEAPSERGIKVEFLCQNIQRKITKKIEELLADRKRERHKEYDRTERKGERLGYYIGRWLKG